MSAQRTEGAGDASGPSPAPSVAFGDISPACSFSEDTARAAGESEGTRRASDGRGTCSSAEQPLRQAPRPSRLCGEQRHSRRRCAPRGCRRDGRAWAAKLGWRLRAQIAGSAWGSDILVTPQRGPHYRWITSQVLRAGDTYTAQCMIITDEDNTRTITMRRPDKKNALPADWEAKHCSVVAFVHHGVTPDKEVLQVEEVHVID